MNQILLGICMILLGLLLSTNTHYVFWGLIVLGIVYIVHGTLAYRQQLRVNRELAELNRRINEITARLQQRETLYRIAADYYASLGIPIMRTYYVGAALLRQWIESTNDEQRKLAQEVVARHHADTELPANDFLDNFELERTVFWMLTGVNVCDHEPTEKDNGKRGTLVLTRPYLYFIPDEMSLWHQSREVAVHVLGHMPFIFIFVAFYEMCHGIYLEFANPFSPRRIKRLKRMFAAEHAFALPLAQICDVKLVEKPEHKEVRPYLEIDAEQPSTPLHYFVSSATRKLDWGPQCRDRILLTAFGEGRSLCQPAAHV